MTLSISQLQNKWNKEKEYYKSQEVGSGVQKFIKDVLKCPEIFNLKEGKLSIPSHKRNNEFLEEYYTKGRRQVDVAIFISPEITIPVEVEQYTHINRGIKQLFEYQTDLEQKYGILTDGFIWRFFNNNVYRTFTLEQIFKKTELFLEFWKDYILTEKYYLSYFEPQGQISLFKETEILSVEENIEVFFQDITKLIRSFANKLQIHGYVNGKDEKEKEKKAIQLTYAYIIQYLLYKTLVDNDFGNFKKEYKEYIKNIHKHLKSKTYKYILLLLDKISLDISKDIYRPFSEEQKFIQKKLADLLHSVEDEISDVSPWLNLFIFIKKFNFANIQNEIFGYIYENYLKDLFEEEKRGQYFTDPNVVNFMIKQIGYTSENLKKKIMQGDADKISIIDPAAGSGTFLYSAVDQVINSFAPNIDENSRKIESIVTKDVFGLDIEEFPLYLAEMNILMRMLPFIIGEKYNNPVEKRIKVFLTKDSIAEFIGTGIESGAQIEFREQEPEYDSFLRDKDDLKEMKDSLEKQREIPRRRFDYVIGNPPYITYNVCSKQGILIFDLIKRRKARLNNIYGVNLHSVPKKPKRYRPNPNIYAFFIALGLALLKPNKKLCYIIPQTLLIAGDLDVIRYHLAKYTMIEKIIIFPNNLFIERGLKQKKLITTSSLIFVAQKKQPCKDHEIEVINYKGSDDSIEDTISNILSNKKMHRKKVQQKELENSYKNWNFLKQKSSFLDFYFKYKTISEDISIYYEHKIAQIKFKSRFYFDSGYSIDEKLALNKPLNSFLNYRFPKLDNNYWTVKKFAGYWPNIRDSDNDLSIKLRQANQSYNLLDSTYKIIWSYINPQRFYFTKEPVIWARNRYCAIGSEEKEELLYLFAILNSQVTNKLLNSLLKTEKEKDYLISTSSVKEYVRVPKITRNNIYIKNEIINITDKLLGLEDKTLSDFVDFSKVLIQKFKEIKVEKNQLLLRNGDKIIKLKIKDNPQLISKTLSREFGSDKLNFKKEKISLSDIRNLSVIDFEKQSHFKDYIDDLVFALYFQVPLERVGINEADKIRMICKRNQYYSLINI